MTKTPPTRTKAAATSPRDLWLTHAGQLARPILSALASRQLRAEMPVEVNPDAPPAPESRALFAHLEAAGRLLTGIAPWLEADHDDPHRQDLASLVTPAIDAGTDPDSPDFFNFTRAHQPLVDAAFLAQAMLRAPKLLWHDLTPGIRQNLAAALKSTRIIKPFLSNWLFFSATIETALACVCETDYDPMRIDYALQQHQQWYRGDGAYGDGPKFRFDYYNSFVIQPMMLDVLDHIGKIRSDWQRMQDNVLRRAQRYAQLLERLIAPDGSYPVIGRSITYRCGAFQLLAQLAWQHRLPEPLSPGQTRCALTAVIERTLAAPGTFDKNGWLQIGLAGHQPGLAERYICTGSLYLCSAAFLPLALPKTDPFWADPDKPITSAQIWSGQNAPADHAID